MTFLLAAKKNQQPDLGYAMTPYYLNRAKAYWREGLNTQQIADKLNMEEHYVYNNLERIKP